MERASPSLRLSPKRRRLSPSDVGDHRSGTLPTPSSGSDPRRVDPELPPLVRRNAQCVSRDDGAAERGILQPSLAQNLTSGRLLDRRDKTALWPSKVDVLPSASPPSCGTDRTDPSPTVSPARDGARVHEASALTRECEDDDAVAATQRSILQELHEIQEESSQACSERPVEDASDVELPPWSGAEDFRYRSRSAPLDATRPSTPERLDPMASDRALVVEQNQSASPRVVVAVSALEQPDEGPISSRVEAASSSAEMRVAAAHAMRLGEVTMPARDEHLVTLPDELDAGALLDDVGDHSLLFEGLDADAFDDIELSPVDPGKADKPTLGSLQGRSPPLSPLMARNGAVSESLNGARGRSRDAEEDAFFGFSSQEIDALDLPLDGPLPAFQGFRTAGNGKLAAPSDAALKRAHLLVFSQQSEAGLSQATDERGLLSEAALRSGSEESKVDVKTEELEGFTGFVGFRNAKGVALRPSEASLAAAKRLFADIENEADEPFNAQASVQPAERTRRRMTGCVKEETVPLLPGESVTGVRRGPDLLPNAGKPISAPKPSHPLSIAVATASSPAQSSNEESATGQGPMVDVAREEQGRTAAEESSSRTLKTPSRSTFVPLRTQQHQAAVPESPRNVNGTPAAQKRISLGMTPRSKQPGTSGSSGRPIFRTPFKGGQAPIRPTASISSPLTTPLGPSRQANIVYPRPRSASQRPKSVQSPKASSLLPRNATTRLASSSSVFDLTPRRPRQSLAASGIVPESVSPLQAIARGVPDEVLVILSDASKAARYAFDGPGGQMLGPQQALAALSSRGCSHVDLRWVKNHWSLILWKLAGFARHRPDEAAWRWSWDEVIRQLLYRYEREINRAQRSCVKRVQEHDSPPHLPMVLFVARILEFQDDSYDEQGQVPRREVTLELSDGWYRIRAELDQVLSEAVLRGRIRVGQKLALAGAKLQSSGDGTEVLDALLTSTLSLCGNSASLARWDAKLGFSRHRFFASLRSLSPEGGLIAAMDVVITKVFPLAFIDAESDSKNGQGARGEAEEHEARDAWLQRLEETRAKLEARFEQGSRKLDVLMLALEAASEGCSRTSSSSSAQLEDEAFSVFCSIEECEDPVAGLKHLVLAEGKTYLLPHLALLVKARLMADSEESRYLLRNELDKLCPPRKVRDFRVVRFRDALLPVPQDDARAPIGSRNASSGTRTRPQSGGKDPYARTVQLTVWDASTLGDRLVEGARFVVTNLVPTSKRTWRKPDEPADVFLATRRDTKWSPVS